MVTKRKRKNRGIHKLLRIELWREISGVKNDKRQKYKDTLKNKVNLLQPYNQKMFVEVLVVSAFEYSIYMHTGYIKQKVYRNFKISNNNGNPIEKNEHIIEQYICELQRKSNAYYKSNIQYQIEMIGFNESTNAFEVVLIVD